MSKEDRPLCCVCKKEAAYCRNDMGIPRTLEPIVWWTCHDCNKRLTEHYSRLSRFGMGKIRGKK